MMVNKLHGDWVQRMYMVRISIKREGGGGYKCALLEEVGNKFRGAGNIATLA